MIRLPSKLLALLILCCLPAFGFAGQLVDKIVAIVNDDIITSAELEQQKKILMARIDLARTKLPAADVLKKQILNQMILDKVQMQLANNTGIDVDTQTINQTMKEIATDEGLSLTTFENKLKNKGISLASFRHHLQQELAINKLRQREISREIVVSSADIDGFLNSPIGQDRSGTEYNLRHILLTNQEAPTPASIEQLKQQAIALAAELKQPGVDFAKMAMTKSSGQQALNGGDLGWRRISEVPTLFVKYIPSMQINEIAGPIQSANGFHIIKLMEKRIGTIKQHLETRVRQILIKPSLNTSDEEAEKSLLAIKQQILKGQDFAKIAERKSEELSTASKGGDLGWLTERSVLPEFYSAMQGLKNGEISQPFKTDMGWHLIQVLDRRSHSTSLDAARNRATEILRERKYQEMLEAWLKRLRDNAKIEILI